MNFGTTSDCCLVGSKYALFAALEFVDLSLV
jgi:hypothetical protein